MEFYGSARFYLSIIVNMQRFLNADDEQGGTFSFSSAPATDLLESTDLSDEIYRHINILDQKIDQFLRNGELNNCIFKLWI